MLNSVLDLLNALLLPLVVTVVLVIVVYLWASARQPARGRGERAAPARRAAPADGAADTAADTDFPDLAEPPPPPAPAVPAVPLTAEVLVVDDSAVVRTKLQRLLSGAGRRVEQARHGREALDRLRQGRYGVLVTDLEMPEMDGFALIRTVQADPRLAGLPIIAITGHANLQAQLSQVGEVQGIHRKPWVDDVLRDDVDRLLHQRAG